MDNEKINRITDAVMRGLAGDTSLKKPSGTFGLAQAKKIAAKVQEKAREMGLNIVVAVSDRGARPILIECMDDAYIASYDVALNKAYTVVALKMSTKTLSTLAAPGGSLYGIQFTNQGQIVIFGGGDPLMYNGEIVGGLGVSGGSEEQDTELARLGKEFFDSI